MHSGFGYGVRFSYIEVENGPKPRSSGAKIGQIGARDQGFAARSMSRG